MNKLIEMVGYDGITEGHKTAVNDLQFVHDELLSAVAYGNKGNDLTKITSYFQRIRNNSLQTFGQEVVNCLTATGRFSTALLRFPEGQMAGGETVKLLAGQNVEQVYDISKALQYAQFKAESILLYMVGSYDIRVSVRFDYQGLIKGENIISFTRSNDAAAEDYVEVIEISLEDLPEYLPIRSKQQNQVVIEIQTYKDSSFKTQRFIKIAPTIESVNNHFDVSGGFSQGFSDGFSIAKGLKLGTINPLISFVNATIDFDIDSYLSKNAADLSYAFACRVACRLLSDKLTGRNLNIFTTSPPELTQAQLDQTNKLIKETLKIRAAKLLMNMQSTATPPAVLEGGTGYEMGSFVANDYGSRGLSDNGPYPAFL